jgi:hypothetical protein
VLALAEHKSNEESWAQMLSVHLKGALRMRKRIRPQHVVPEMRNTNDSKLHGCVIARPANFRDRGEEGEKPGD